VKSAGAKKKPPAMREYHQGRENMKDQTPSPRKGGGEFKEPCFGVHRSLRERGDFQIQTGKKRRSRALLLREIEQPIVRNVPLNNT